MKPSLFKKSASLLAVIGLVTGTILHAETSEAERLRKLENELGALKGAVGDLQKENADLRKQVSIEPTSAAAKLRLSEPIQEMRIYGDARLRYAFNEGRVVDGQDHGEMDRFRYKFRLGLDVKVIDNWFFGLQFQAGANARSSNITMGGVPVFNKASTSTDTFVTAVDSSTIRATTSRAVTRVNFGDTVFVGQLYLKYSPWDWVSVEGGRIPNPFVGGNTGVSGGSLLVWDPDINPQGFAEQFKYTFGPWGEKPCDSSDGSGKKTVLPLATTGGMTLDVFANFAQFVYEDVTENNFNKAPGPEGEIANRSDLWMLGFQVGAKANFTKTTYFQLAPAFYAYTNGGDTLRTPFNGDATQVVVNSEAELGLLTFNQTGVNDLEILELPAEFGWTMWHIPFKIFGEFETNLEAGDRAREAGHSDKRSGTAYSAGVSIGQLKQKGSWELKAWWQHDEQFSLDPNIVDDDIFDGHLNMQGYVIRASYAFTDAAWLALVYSNGSRIDRSLGTGGGGGLLGSVGFPLDRVQLLFVDVNLKF